jgi:hypothetical protein
VAGIDYEETFSPVVKFDSIRTVLSIATAKNLEMMQFNMKTAFLYGEIEEDIYIAPPTGFEEYSDAGMVCKLNKALYGLKQSSRVWNRHFNSFLVTYNLVPTSSDPCVYISIGSIWMILMIFFDDGIICSTTKEGIADILGYMEKAFEITNSSPEIYVGLRIIQDKARLTMHVDQSRHIARILARYGFENTAPVAVPADPCSFLDYEFVAENPIDNFFPYRNVVDNAQFASNGTRIDITYATGQVSKFLQAPKAPHVNAAKRLLKYLKGHPNVSITYTGGGPTPNQLVGYYDADFAFDLDDLKSRSGYVLMLNNGPVLWGSQK